MKIVKKIILSDNAPSDPEVLWLDSSNREQFGKVVCKECLNGKWIEIGARTTEEIFGTLENGALDSLENIIKLIRKDIADIVPEVYLTQEEYDSLSEKNPKIKYLTYES